MLGKSHGGPYKAPTKKEERKKKAKGKEEREIIPSSIVNAIEISGEGD